MTLDMTGSNTFSESKAQTGVAVGQKRIMLIKKIIISYDVDIAAALAVGANTAWFVALATKQDLAAMPGLEGNEVIYYHAGVLAAGGDGATAAESPGALRVINGFPSYVEFDDPIPVADDEISLYMHSIGMATALTVVAKIYYAIADVSLEEALTILESYR